MFSTLLLQSQPSFSTRLFTLGFIIQMWFSFSIESCYYNEP